MIKFIAYQWRYFWEIYIRYDVIYNWASRYARLTKFIRNHWEYFQAVYVRHDAYPIVYANINSVGKPIRIQFSSEKNTLHAINKRLSQAIYLEGRVANSYRTISLEKPGGLVVIHFQPYRS